MVDAKNLVSSKSLESLGLYDSLSPSFSHLKYCKSLETFNDLSRVESFEDKTVLIIRNYGFS